MGRNVGGKDGQCTAHHPHGAVGMPARSASVHFAQATSEPRHDVVAALAAGQPSQVVSDAGEPEDARTALAGALIGQVASDPC
jgi:hypothetical protein